MEKTTRFLWTSSILLVLTIGLYTYMTNMHYDLSYGLSEGGSICNVNATFNCDAVDASSYSRLFGIPIALWALMTNAALFVIVIAALFTDPQRRIQYQKISLLIAGYLAFMSILMGVISLTRLNTFCLLCLTQYVFSFLNFGVLLASLPRPERRLTAQDLRPLFQGGEQGLRLALIALILVPIATAVAHASMVQSRESVLLGPGHRLEVDQYVSEWRQNPVQTFDESKGLASGADAAQAKVTIVEFADFLCPHCRASNPMFEAFVLAHSDVRFIFFTYPLDGQCNEGLGPHDGKRCELAQAVYCAAHPMGSGTANNAKGLEAKHILFNAEEPLTVNQIAQELKVDAAAFSQCVTSPAAHDGVLQEARQGSNAKIRGTPTVFLNGREVPMAQLREVLERVYEAAKQ